MGSHCHIYPQNSRCPPISPNPISPNPYMLGLEIGLGSGFDYFRQYNVIRRIGIRRNGAEPPSNINVIYRAYVVEKYFQCATIPSLRMWVYLHSFSRCCLPNMPTSAKFPENLILHVDDFDTSRKRVCEFLLVINSNFGPCTVSEIRRHIG